MFNSDSSSHKTRSVLLFCSPAHTDSLWPRLTRVKSGQAQFDASQNGPASQVGLEQFIHQQQEFFPTQRERKIFMDTSMDTS